MSVGKIIDLVRFSQQAHLPGTRLVPGHSDQGYGILQDDDGREVYFSQRIVQGLHGFDALRHGQRLDYTLDDAFLRATSVRPVATSPAKPSLDATFQSLIQPMANGPNAGEGAV